MMKNIKLYIAMLLIGLAVFSCTEDESVVADFRYPNVIVVEEPTLSGIYLDDYSFTPQFATVVGQDTILIDESQYDDYLYEWRMNVLPGRYDTVSTVISTQRELAIKLEAIPSTDAYYLVLRITNKEVGFVQTFDWQVEVLNELGQGMLIAHTEDGGLTSDINLLMTKAYNASMEATDEDILYRNFYSEINGEKLNGLVSNLSFCNSTNNKALSALVKGEALYVINSISYKLEKTSDFFYFEPEVFNPQTIFNYYGAYSLLINNGAVYSQTAAAGAKYAYIDEETYKYEINDGYVNRWYSNSYFGGALTAYDEKNSQFVFVDSFGEVSECDAPDAADDWAFNPRALPDDLEYVTGGQKGYYSIFMLMKSKSTNDFSMYKLAATSSYEVSGDAVYDMSNCVDLDRATAYAFSYAYDEFYYAVDNKLYVAILNVATPSSSVTYSLPAGENISHLKFHRKTSGLTAWSESLNEEGVLETDYVSSYENVMTVASYNGTEGFIRTLPIQYGGAGGIADEKWVYTYGGFGKITAIELRY